ncbi:MAG: hypothetical protein N3G18_05255, partial [Candidatus Saccharicenans sp.]|nr:hypothetical protein [Candidatus Saccharicenans sp.]
FVGKYSLLEQVLSVDLKVNTLTMTIPGQPVYELIPVPGDEFVLKGISIARIRFIVDQKGEVTFMVISQPGGVFEYKRLTEGQEKAPEKK